MGIFNIFKNNEGYSDFNTDVIEEYRDFYSKNKNLKISYYGLIPLGEKGNSKFHKKPYSDVANIDFQFSKSCIWEDIANEYEKTNILNRVEYGNITIANEGCEIYWILITSGKYKGKVWLLTELGITPIEENLTLSNWKTKQLESNNKFWYHTLKNWEPFENAFFFTHAPKKMVTLKQSIFGINTKMCEDCLNFISKASQNDKREHIITDDTGTRVFEIDGKFGHIKK